jgi:DNA adenine methylase
MNNCVRTKLNIFSYIGSKTRI